MLTQCRLAVMDQNQDQLANRFGFNPLENRTALNEHVNRQLQKEHMGPWTKIPDVPTFLSLSAMSHDDDVPLKTFRSKFTVATAPKEALNFILSGRRFWDLDLVEMRKIVDVDEQSDIVQFVSESMSPHPHRDYCLYRSWRENHNTGKCSLYITSTTHPKVTLLYANCNL